MAAWLLSLRLGSTMVTIAFVDNETGDVVDVTVGIVARYTLAKPDHLLNAEIVSENLLVIFTA